jgi:hypothetical protein
MPWRKFRPNDSILNAVARAKGINKDEVLNP